jgi:hypothetical protein
MKRGRPQCKDIPDAPILAFLAEHGGIGCTVWRDDAGEPFPRSALRAMPAGTPRNLARAKMEMLVRRGLAYGCGCGCRGDWELTEKGTALAGGNP